MSDIGKTSEQLVSELAQLRQRIAELEASESKQQTEGAPLRAALDATVNAIVVTDRTGLIQWVNPAFCNLTGYTVVEAVGKNPRDLVKSGQHGPEFYRNLWETILRGASGTAKPSIVAKTAASTPRNKRSRRYGTRRARLLTSSP